MTEKVKIPSWYWVITIILLLWNITGLASFIMSAMATKADLMDSGYTEAQSDLMLSLPFWTKYMYLIATSTGLIAAIGLVAKKRFALPFFIISLIFAAIHHLYIYATTEALSVMPSMDKGMSILVISICILQILFSRSAKDKGWLN
ncbi:MAG: hypothetical protein AAF487_11925 [Bacteroidota bacterium]